MTRYTYFRTALDIQNVSLRLQSKLLCASRADGMEVGLWQCWKEPDFLKSEGNFRMYAYGRGNTRAVYEFVFDVRRDFATLLSAYWMRRRSAVAAADGAIHKELASCILNELEKRLSV